MTPDPDHIQAEFTRVAPTYAERTAGRFDAMDAVRFSRLEPDESVLEVAAGAAGFLSLFKDGAARLIALDLTKAMLVEGVRRHPSVIPVQGDALRLPFRSRSVDLVVSAQALHHMGEPLPVLKEMRRVSKAEGRVYVVDQVATESYEEMAFMNDLEALRDPTHASSRPPSVLRMLVTAAGLEIVDEKIFSDRSSLSRWMPPEEFPPERIRKVKMFIERFGAETGMGFERQDEDWTFTRRRIMLLARRA